MRNFLRFLKSKSFFIQLGLSILLVIILVFLLLRWLNSTTNHGEFVVVPDFSKMSVMDMRKAAEDADLRYKIQDSANFNPDYPRFSIISQEPEAGSKVKEDRMIYFSVNPSGYKKVTIPNVIQVTQRNASSMLRAVGLDIQRVTYIDQIGKNMVYYIKFKGKYVKPGDRVPKTSKVELVCGNGRVAAREKIKADSE
jgi:beta-lactam-binding protein with PASTA domain